MRKITLLCASLGLLASLQAKDNVFVGVQTGMSYSKSSYTSFLGNERTTRNSGTYQTAHIGKYFDAHRVSLSMQSSEIGFAYDYMIDLEDQKLTPYIGTGLSYYRHTYNNGTKDTISSLSVPIALGFTYPLDDRFELDVGFRYTTFISSSGNHSDGLVMAEQESSYGYHIGFNYSF
ncbi:MAG: outer membrane beta-barrel protein [Campylobacterales bacterium]|nr:outer membrane beta-barrel protein [Campylobacterales bacterium]